MELYTQRFGRDCRDVKEAQFLLGFFIESKTFFIISDIENRKDYKYVRKSSITIIYF